MEKNGSDIAIFINGRIVTSANFASRCSLLPDKMFLIRESFFVHLLLFTLIRHQTEADGGKEGFKTSTLSNHSFNVTFPIFYPL